jgi:hypothetical protein
MSQVNVNRPADTGDRTAAAGINLLAVVLGLVVAGALVLFLFMSFGRGGSTGGTGSQPAQQPQQPAPNININPPPAPNINVNPPGNQAPAPQAPSGGNAR